MNNRRVHAIVVAAGSGARFGNGTDKQLALLKGRTALEHVVAALVSSGVVNSIIVVTRQDLIERVQSLLGAAIDHVIGGGATRASSVRAGLDIIKGSHDDKVLIHDAARPLLAPTQVVSVVKALDKVDAVTVAVPTSDTLLETNQDIVVNILDRDRVFRAQTPQGFRLGILRTAHQTAAADTEFIATDDCAVIRRFSAGTRISVIPGSERNLKITTVADLAMAEQLLTDRQ